MCSLDPSSKNYKDMVTDVMISVSAAHNYHQDILECLDEFSITVEVSVWLSHETQFYDQNLHIQEYLPKWLR